jgi:hypothetical protein
MPHWTLIFLAAAVILHLGGIASMGVAQARRAAVRRSPATDGVMRGR